ncbi:MAG: hypothetical protein Q4A11_03705 [Brachymonas sp.]|nr:hypothetical protein [Brachymonas sp.]
MRAASDATKKRLSGAFFLRWLFDQASARATVAIVGLSSQSEDEFSNTHDATPVPWLVVGYVERVLCGAPPQQQTQKNLPHESGRFLGGSKRLCASAKGLRPDQP